VLFSDIRSYSTITEDMTPYQIVEMLNIYLSEMTGIVRRHGGFIDKYIGDGLMACFGGPVPTEDPAGDAARAALEMIAVLKGPVTESLQAGGFPVFNIGIGLHYGPVVMGNIGSAARMDYTVIGDAVNVASRVEGQTKEFGMAVIITQDCLEAASGEFSAELVGERQVKGRERPVRMYSLVDPDNPGIFRY
jgi:adenylate cyclase